MDKISAEFIRNVKLPRTRQAQAIAGYAHLIRAYHVDSIDWPAVNRAIMDRWPTALSRIKNAAWKIAEGRS